MVFSGLITSLALLLLAIAVLLFVKSRQTFKKTGLPPGKIIYSDTGIWHENHEPLHSSSLRLIGKPDYLVEVDNGQIIPVEIKSGSAPPTPRDGHVMQLISYCVLVEEQYGIRPSHGIIQYKNRAFAVDFSVEMEVELLELLQEMRRCYQEPSVNRDHDDYRRCASCGYKNVCQESLA